jgi:hypothetical protein
VNAKKTLTLKFRINKEFFKAKQEEKERDLLLAYLFLERISETLLPIADSLQFSNEES